MLVRVIDGIFKDVSISHSKYLFISGHSFERSRMDDSWQPILIFFLLEALLERVKIRRCPFHFVLFELAVFQLVLIEVDFELFEYVLFFERI